MYFGLDSLPNSSVLDLKNMSNPCYVDLAARQIQTSWVQQICQTHVTLDLVSVKSKHLRSRKHVKLTLLFARPMLLWTWLAPSPDTLGLASMSNPRYCLLGSCYSEFGVTLGPASMSNLRYLGLATIRDPCQLTMRCMCNPESGYYSGRKNMIIYLFFHLKIYFLSIFHPKKPIFNHVKP